MQPLRSSVPSADLVSASASRPTGQFRDLRSSVEPQMLMESHPVSQELERLRNEYGRGAERMERACERLEKAERALAEAAGGLEREGLRVASPGASQAPSSMLTLDTAPARTRRAGGRCGRSATSASVAGSLRRAERAIHDSSRRWTASSGDAGHDGDRHEPRTWTGTRTGGM